MGFATGDNYLWASLVGSHRVYRLARLRKEVWVDYLWVALRLERSNAHQRHHFRGATPTPFRMTLLQPAMGQPLRIAPDVLASIPFGSVRGTAIRWPAPRISHDVASIG